MVSVNKCLTVQRSFRNGNISNESTENIWTFKFKTERHFFFNIKVSKAKTPTALTLKL